MRITEPYIVFPRKLKSGRIVYYYQYRKADGTRSSAYSTGCNTSAKAKRFCQHLYITGQFKAHAKETFENFANGYFDAGGELDEWRKLSGSPIMPRTLRSYKSLLENNVMPFFRGYVLETITVDVVKKWVLWASEKWSPKTVNSAQNCLSMILNNAIEKNIIQKNPCLLVGTRTVQKKERQLLTVEEIRKIYQYDWKNQIKRRAFLLAVITGMRIGEVLALRKEDVHENWLDVKHSWNHIYGLTPTKTKQNRKVPIPKGLDFGDDTEWVIPSQFGHPMSSGNVYKRFVSICEELKIDLKGRNLTQHTLRNFFISWLKGKNVPEQKIKATVGHTDGSITDWYTYWKPEMLTEVYEAQKELYEAIIKED